MKLEDIGPVKDFNGSPFLLCFFFTVRHVNGLSRRLQWKGRCLYNTYIPTFTQNYKYSFLEKIRILRTPMKDSIEEKSTLYMKKKKSTATPRKESTLENRNSFKNFQLELLFRLTIFFGWSEPSVLFMDLN